MDFKRFAMVVGIMVLLPLFLGLFFDAIYAQPKYENYCNNTRFSMPEKIAPAACQDNSVQELECTSKPGGTAGIQLFECKNKAPVSKCIDDYNNPLAQECSNNEGSPQFKTNDSCCQVYESCDYCNKDYTRANMVYNRNLFFILAPIGLFVVLLGIYVLVEYLGAGLMFAGLITLFYATIRYFSDMSKLSRAFVILLELLIIIWIGYKKIGANRDEHHNLFGSKKIKGKR